MNPVDQYATDVVAGLIPAGTYHVKACARHLHDRDREGTPDFPYVFVWTQGKRFLDFARKFKHYKGEWAGQPFVPSGFQEFRLGSYFGWRHKDTGLRRFTTAYIEVPRKHGKSFEASLVNIYCTFFEGEPGAEGYCIATKEKQATDMVFRDIKQLIQSSGLGKKLDVRVKSVFDARTQSKIEPLGSDSETLDGLNPHSIVTDELHAFKTRGLLDVMESATGARRNPSHYQITTAGDDLVSVCGDQHDYACKILDGAVDDLAAQTFFACIAHADPADDPWSETTWIKANPHWGISVNPDDMRKLAQKAQQMPSAAAEFKQKRLNLWVNATAPCLSIDGWRKGQSDWTIDDMKHEPCFVGIDLAAKIDLMALAFLFPPTAGRSQWRLLTYAWTPEETVRERAHRDRAPYLVWIDQGWLHTVPGAKMTPEPLRQQLLAHRHDFDIERIGYDEWHADTLITALKDEDGFTDEQVLVVPQTFAGLASAEATFKAEVLAGNLDARGCPLTAWCASNVVEQTDGKGNIFFTKKKSRGRIDPIKAATTAMALALRFTAPQTAYAEPEWIDESEFA